MGRTILLKRGDESKLKDYRGRENEIVLTKDTMQLFIWSQDKWHNMRLESWKVKQIFDNLHIDERQKTFYLEKKSNVTFWDRLKTGLKYIFMPSQDG